MHNYSRFQQYGISFASYPRQPRYAQANYPQADDKLQELRRKQRDFERRLKEPVTSVGEMKRGMRIVQGGVDEGCRVMEEAVGNVERVVEKLREELEGLGGASGRGMVMGRPY